MSPDDNKAIIRTYVETIFNQQQVDRAGEQGRLGFRRPRCLAWSGAWAGGRQAEWAMYLAGLPDLRVTIEELVAEGDKVACRSMRAPPRGAAGHPTTGKQLRIGGISIFRLAEGEDRRALGAVGSASADAAARRHLGPGRARVVHLPNGA